MCQAIEGDQVPVIMGVSTGKTEMGSETMDFDGRFLDPIVREEGGDLDTLVPLELDNLTHLLVVNKCAVAGKFLLEGFQEFLGIILFGQPLQRG